ncbi:MAG: BMP family ABC transporter substrate-binding protein [Myxococcales bacterium]|nr:BMP family ABC transporter substrate-binding protein [Myxococcales bacterium]
MGGQPEATAGGKRPRALAILAGLIAAHAVVLLVGHVAFPAKAGRVGQRKIGLVFDVGGKDDKSFNESAWRGVMRAEAELGVFVQTIEPGDGSDRETALRQFAAAGFDLVIGVGFIFSSDLERLAAQYPRIQFAGVDFSPSDAAAPLPNLLGLTFREQDGSFLVGVAAGLASKTRVVGFVGGMRIPLIRKFEAGFAAGVHHVCPTCRVLSAYAGAEPKAFADPATGYELALAQLDRDADVIFHASGKTGDGVLAAVKERQALGIGVDSDQYELAPCCVLTSMIKRIDEAVFTLVAQGKAGVLQTGMRELGLAENGVGLVMDSRNLATLTPPMRAQIESLRAAIERGDIIVPTEPR